MECQNNFRIYTSLLAAKLRLAPRKTVCIRRVELGCPKQIFSDNETNFIGSLSQLIQVKRLLQDRHNKNSLHDHVRDSGIKWTTIPARAPSCGGPWEAAVKSMKLLYHKTIVTGGKFKLNEMYIARNLHFLASRQITTCTKEDSLYSKT